VLFEYHSGPEIRWVRTTPRIVPGRRKKIVKNNERLKWTPIRRSFAAPARNGARDDVLDRRTSIIA
jgi:hypothetical protein